MRLLQWTVKAKKARAIKIHCNILYHVDPLLGNDYEISKYTESRC
jgi:hypothetical protein